MSSEPQFDHEKLDVYQRSLEFITWTTPVLEEARADTSKPTGAIRDQLDRARISILLNLAEGNGKRRPAVRAKFFDDARGSATECAACLDVLVAMGVASSSRMSEGKGLLVRIVSMLARLIDRNDDLARAKEDTTEYGTAETQADR